MKWRINSSTFPSPASFQRNHVKVVFSTSFTWLCWKQRFELGSGLITGLVPFSCVWVSIMERQDLMTLKRMSELQQASLMVQVVKMKRHSTTYPRHANFFRLKASGCVGGSSPCHLIDHRSVCWIKAPVSRTTSHPWIKADDHRGTVM